jgi:hypothetical protein
MYCGHQGATELSTFPFAIPKTGIAECGASLPPPNLSQLTYGAQLHYHTGSPPVKGPVLSGAHTEIDMRLT